MTITAHDTFWGHVANGTGEPGGCWLWLGKVNPEGYGQATGITHNGLAGWSAHRLAYTLVHGPIPDGMTIDHLCRVRNCVNPDHLEPVTRGENVRRGWEHRRRPGQEPGIPTPARQFRPYPPELWDRVKAQAAANGETVTDVLNRALEDYDRKNRGKR